DFRLNTQCSAGNGYFLQSTAACFGYTVGEYADVAFQAQRAPAFHYGCAVFLEQDIIHFQQLGWEAPEILAGLARVLPKNVWIYVVQEPNLAKLGKTFLLQGGSHYNLAVVKAQADFIRERVPDARIYVHPHAGESGALGAALEALETTGRSRFIGFDAVERLSFSARRDEETRCSFCRNRCLRTFVDLGTAPGRAEGPGGMGMTGRAIPLRGSPGPGESGISEDSRRYIVATCDKGTVEDLAQVRALNQQEAANKRANPNFAELAARQVFRSYRPSQVNGHGQGEGLMALLRRKVREGPSHYVGALAWVGGTKEGPQARVGWVKRVDEARQRRGALRIGIPRTLAMYSYAPFFTAYLESLGVKPQNIVWSDYTSDQLYREGSRRGSIDPCFPAKVALPHVHNLLYKKRVDLVLFPIIFNYPTELVGVQAPQACPSVQIMPEVARASLTTENDTFAELGIPYHAPVFHMGEPNLFEKQMHEFFRGFLGVGQEENRQAMAEGYRALDAYVQGLRQQAREILEKLEEEGRLGIVMLGRPYHNDPGLNHEIPHDLQKLGYPIFTIDSLPIDEDILERLFGEEVRRGDIESPLSINDVWKNSYSENTNRKVWAAKYVARHPNLVAIDLSSFKCGMDAPIYHVIDGILAAADTPYFTFHEIDENRPAGSIKLRVETLYYFLKRYEAELRQRQAIEAHREVHAR
ncbi:MAG TPA: acyl-CoA dehydratase activase-related protein, partial [Dehalococcoidia bacterium]|nr:acyl-CoA dehydratase activase-related protein [Dehalococcoidia bacterium]